MNFLQLLSVVNTSLTQDPEFEGLDVCVWANALGFSIEDAFAFLAGVAWDHAYADMDDDAFDDDIDDYEVDVDALDAINYRLNGPMFIAIKVNRRTHVVLSKEVLDHISWLRDQAQALKDQADQEACQRLRDREDYLLAFLDAPGQNQSSVDTKGRDLLKAVSAGGVVSLPTATLDALYAALV